MPKTSKRKKKKTENEKKKTELKIEKTEFFRYVGLVNKNLVFNEEYVNNDWPLRDISKVNFKKTNYIDDDFYVLDSKGLIDKKKYLNTFEITSPFGRKILNKSKNFRFCKNLNSDNLNQKYIQNFSDLTKILIKPFDLIIKKLIVCPICAEKILSNHSCKKRKNS